MPKLSEFCRLETLIIHNVEFKYLETVLNKLLSLSSLSTLVISTIDTVSVSSIMLQIFRLPAVKYCELSFASRNGEEPLTINTNTYSPMEHLIITSHIYLEELYSLLSYVPHLRRLSLDSLSNYWDTSTQLSPSWILNHLTHVSLNMKSIEFVEFKKLVITAFYSVRVLSFTLDLKRQSYVCAQTYMNANEWKQLILSHIPNLQIFDIRLEIGVASDLDELRIKTEINRFSSTFWIERQWFFIHRLYSSRDRKYFMFYSAKPYRRKHYILSEQFSPNTSLYHYESNLDSVQHVQIDDEESIVNCQSYFPNVTQLTFDEKFSLDNELITIDLNHTVPLKQLTKLVIGCDYFPIQTIIKILYDSPNIHTLELKSIFCFEKNTDFALIKQSEDFQAVCSTNVVRYMNYDGGCTLEKIELLVALCPRMKHLKSDILATNLTSIIRFLLCTTKQNASKLSLFCIPNAPQNWTKKVETLIESETLVDDYTLKTVQSDLHLCW